ncbi:MAG: YfiT family bacillithiol transferase [Bacteroidia bacterium]
MELVALDELKYPTGKFAKPESFTVPDIKNRIKILSDFPALLSKEVLQLDEESLKYLHRPGGWTIRQVVHHLADSHCNAFIRVKLALTENNPTIKPYIESEWAKLPDTTDSPVEWSLKILDGLHARWTVLLLSLNKADLGKAVMHPEYNWQMSIADLVFMYSWHCGHHLAHIKNAKKFRNKF